MASLFNAKVQQRGIQYLLHYYLLRIFVVVCSCTKHARPAGVEISCFYCCVMLLLPAVAVLAVVLLAA